MAQLAAEAVKNAQARRVRFEAREAAKPQLTAAIIAATASPMSSTAIAAWSPPMRNAVHATKATDRMAAAAAAIVKARQPRKPKPMITGIDPVGGGESTSEEGVCGRAGANVGEGDLATTSRGPC